MRISNWYNTSMGQTKRTVIGILAHVDAGKTTLIESILYQTGAIGALGRVDHRDSFLILMNKKEIVGLQSILKRLTLFIKISKYISSIHQDMRIFHLRWKELCPF